MSFRVFTLLQGLEVGMTKSIAAMIEVPENVFLGTRDLFPVSTWKGLHNRKRSFLRQEDTQVEGEKNGNQIANFHWHPYLKHFSRVPFDRHSSLEFAETILSLIADYKNNLRQVQGQRY